MSFRRIFILTQKEFKQLIRDPLSIALGILLPVVLLLICGFGVSTDVRNIRMVIVVPEPSEMASQICARFQSNGFFDSQIVRTTAEAEALMRTHQADTSLYLPQDFTRKLQSGDAVVQIVVNASNPSPAFLKQGYILTVLAGCMGSLADPNALEIQTRQWFNEENRSAFNIVPGMIVIILTIIGALLTSMLMAREYELGNLESMFVTPMRSIEMLLAKMFTNFGLGMVGLTISLVLGHYLFGLPTRGNIAILIFGSSLYLIVALCLGLLISSLTKNQFLAVIVTVIATFLPSYILSGFLFEIKSMPAFLQGVTNFVPARYYVEFLQTSLLVGNVWRNVFWNLSVLSGIAVLLLALAVVKNPKKL
ncbi:MAG: ABC transporter permease [Thermoguttaceae bacterium]|nr:ABC transporter permease [Thermoguttaceae bacterium]